MDFIKDAWYCAGFSSDLVASALKPITMLGQALVLFRRGDGSPAALADRCPHRFAPLSMGQLIDGQVRCGYHGLRFDDHGQCRFNPHDPLHVPKNAIVAAYPTLEKHGALWVWMGDPSGADPDLLPDFAEIDERPGWSRIEGYLHVSAHYQLIVDNLMDLSHVPFLHPFLSSSERMPDDFRPDIRTEQAGERVIAINEFHRMPTTALYQMLWEREAPPSHSTMRANMRWDPPALMLLDTGAAPTGGLREDGPSAPSAHWITPETESSSHYFWAAARDRHVGDSEVSAQMKAGFDNAFRNEDEPMIEACQRNMGGADLMSLKPVLIPTDTPAVRTRRVVANRLEAQIGA